MQPKQAWKLLIVIFAIFWVMLAVVLIATDFPFYIISIALSTILMLSILVVALAWAYTHDY